MIKNYKTIERVVEAVQFLGTEENLQDLFELTGSSEMFLNGTIRADIGEWIVKKSDETDREGEFEVLTDEEFQVTYREFKTSEQRIRN